VAAVHRQDQVEFLEVARRNLARALRAQVVAAVPGMVLGALVGRLTDVPVAEAGRGVVLYMRGHEGRGIGLLHKLQAYQLQDLGHDTVDANLELGLPADARDYGTGAQILYDLGVRSMRLLTNNPAKRAGLEGYGLTIVGREGLAVYAHPENVRYLRTKRDRMGHLLDELDEIAEGLA
jgi:3,4-dihydroxy 2-butanone 4-phosphate synthase/GTP cyclohydrolase II